MHTQFSTPRTAAASPFSKFGHIHEVTNNMEGVGGGINRSWVLGTVIYTGTSSATLTDVFPCFFLSCKANARVKPAKMGHGPHSSKLLYFSMYCLFRVVLSIVCVNVYCTTATGCQPNCSQQIYIISYIIYEAVQLETGDERFEPILIYIHPFPHHSYPIFFLICPS